MHARVFHRSCLVLAYIGGVLASSWAVFSDTACTKSLDTIDGQNGYPDGVCTDISESSPTSSYKAFMFTTLDDGCTPTIYQADISSDTCSGTAVVAYKAVCYNTSWVYYSIDECSKAAATSTTPLSSSATSSTSSGSAAAGSTLSNSSGGISGGAIAGAVVGSVCGLGIIAAVSVYFFWFRPKQQEKKKREQLDESALPTNTTNEAPDSEKPRAANAIDGSQKIPELPQPPPELPSPNSTAELPSTASRIAEAPGDKGGFELDQGSHPVELPGDQEYRSSDSIQSDR